MCTIIKLSHDHCSNESDFTSFSLLMAHLICCTIILCMNYITIGLNIRYNSIVSMHLATRANNKILRTPPPHINSSKETLLHLTHRTLAQLRTNKSLFLKSYLHQVDANSHPSPLFPLCTTHTHIQQTSSLQIHPRMYQVFTPGFD